MLTGSFPFIPPVKEHPCKLWQVEGKDHFVPDPAVIRAWAIGVVDMDCFKCIESNDMS